MAELLINVLSFPFSQNIFGSWSKKSLVRLFSVGISWWPVCWATVYKVFGYLCVSYEMCIFKLISLLKLTCSALSYWLEFCIRSECGAWVGFVCHEHYLLFYGLPFYSLEYCWPLRQGLNSPGWAGTCHTDRLTLNLEHYSTSTWDYNTLNQLQLLTVCLNGSGNISYALAPSFCLGERRNFISF